MPQDAQTSFEQALDSNTLWTYSGGHNSYIRCQRLSATRKTRTGFTIPANPGNLNHYALSDFSSGKKQNGNVIFLISASDPNL